MLQKGIKSHLLSVLIHLIHEVRRTNKVASNFKLLIATNKVNRNKMKLISILTNVLRKQRFLVY